MQKKTEHVESLGLIWHSQWEDEDVADELSFIINVHLMLALSASSGLKLSQCPG